MNLDCVSAAIERIGQRQIGHVGMRVVVLSLCSAMERVHVDM